MSVGTSVGAIVGTNVGISVGTYVGAIVGADVGMSVDVNVGTSVGTSVGISVNATAADDSDRRNMTMQSFMRTTNWLELWKYSKNSRVYDSLFNIYMSMCNIGWGAVDICKLTFMDRQHFLNFFWNLFDENIQFPLFRIEDVERGAELSFVLNDQILVGFTKLFWTDRRNRRCRTWGRT